MSTLKTNNLQHIDGVGSANIQMTADGGAVHSGISTFNKVNVGSATTFTDELVVNGDARITGILTIGTGSITLDPNNDEIKLGQTKLKRESDGEIKITDLQGNLKGLRGKRFRIQVSASEKNKNGVEVGTGATITSPADNELAFRTNDEPRVKIDSNGKVGIGTTVPNTLLHVHGTASSQKLITLSGSTLRNNYIGVNGSDNLEIGADEDNQGNDSSIRFRVDGSEKVRITSDGEVLINKTTSPTIDTNFVVSGASPVSVYTGQQLIEGSETSGAADTGGALIFGGHDGSEVRNWANIYGMKENGTGSNTASYMSFHTRPAGGAPTERIRINSSGNFGLGQTNPAYLLDAKTTGNQIGRFETTATSDLAIELKNAQGSMFFGLGGGEEFAVGTTWNLNDASDNLFCIKQTGNVGINSITPNARLEVNVADGNDGFRVRNSSEHNNKFQIHARSSGDTDLHTVAYYHKDGYPLNHYTYAGTSYNYGSVTCGQTRSNAASPTNYYRHGAHAFNAYSGRTDSSSNYRSRIFMKAYDDSDTGDRNIIYYVDSGSDTASVDYDQDQKFGVKANGQVQGGGSFWTGRVESDEGTVNSVYLGSTGVGYVAYPGSSAQYTRAIARTSDNTDDVYKADTGGGVVFKVESSGKVEADGAYATGASDYAEYFEWLDGNTSNEDRRGITVVLDGEKIRPATDSDDASKIIGVVSALPAVVGDCAWSEWQLAHLKDAYGSWVTEDKEYLVWNKFGTFTDTDGVKKSNPQPDINDYNMDADHQVLVSDIEAEKAKGNIPQAAIDQNLRVTKPSRTYNPDYDPSRDYVPRSHRKEWDAIGLVGKLVVRRGQPVGPNWILMTSNSGVDPNDNSIILDRYLVR